MPLPTHRPEKINIFGSSWACEWIRSEWDSEIFVVVARVLHAKLETREAIKKVGSLHDKIYPIPFMFYYGSLSLPLCFFPLPLRFSCTHRIQFNFRFHLSKVSDACAKKLNYTVCKWHNGEFYYTRHMHVHHLFPFALNGGNYSLFSPLPTGTIGWMVYVVETRGTGILERRYGFMYWQISLGLGIVSEAEKTGKPDIIFRQKVSQHVKIWYDIIVCLNSFSSCFPFFLENNITQFIWLISHISLSVKVKRVARCIEGIKYY